MDSRNTVTKIPGADLVKDIDKMLENPAKVISDIQSLVHDLTQLINAMSILLDENKALVALFDVGVVAGVSSGGSLDATFFGGDGKGIQISTKGLMDRFLTVIKEQKEGEKNS